MRRLVRYLLLLLLLLVFAAGYWVMGTEAGLRWTWEQVRGRSDGALAAERVEGILAGPLRIQGLTLRTARAEVAVGRLGFNWAPSALLRGTFKLSDIDAEAIRVDMAQAPPQAQDDGAFELPALPLKVAVEDADIRDVLVQPADGEPLRLERAILTAGLGPEGLQVRQLRLRAPQGQLDVRGAVGRQPGQPVELSLEWSVKPEPLVRPVSGSARIGGSVPAPEITIRVEAPFTATAQADLRWGDSPLAWEARVEVEDLQPARLNPEWPALRVAATAEGEGGVDKWRFGGGAALDGSPLGPLQMRLALNREANLWRLSELRLSSRVGGDYFSAGGTWNQAGGLTDVENADLRARWQGLGWPLDDPEWISREGRMRVTGRPERYRLELQAQLQAPQVGPSRWSLEGQGDLAGLDIGKIRGELLGGGAEGAARVQWQPAVRWSARMALTDIDPGLRWPQWEGRLAARLGSEGELGGSGMKASASVESLSGELRGYPVRGEADVSVDNRMFTLGELRLASGTAQLTGSGSVGERWDLGWNLSAPDLSHALPGLSGSLRSRGRVSGPRDAPAIAASATGRALEWDERRVGELEAEAQVDLGGGRKWVVDASARGMELGTPAGLSELYLSARGLPERHTIDIRSQLGEGSARVSLAGALEGARWSGRVQEGRIEVGQMLWRQQEPAALALSPAGFGLDSWCWSQRGGARACVSGQLRDRAWEGRLSISRFPLRQLQPWLPGPELTLAGEMTGEAVAAGTAGALGQIDVNLRSPGGRIDYALEHESMQSEYREIVLRIGGTPSKGVTAAASVELGPGEFVRASAALPGWMPGMEMVPEQVLRGSLDAQLRRTEWIGLLFPDVVIAGGLLESRFKLAGTLADPRLSGQGSLRDAETVLPALGISLESIRLALRPASGAAALATLQVRSGPGEVSAEGRIEVSDAGSWAWTGTVSGERFELLRLPLGRALVSPELSLDVGAGRIRVAGKVAVPEARILLPELPEGSVRSSPDVVVVDRPAQETGGNWRVETDVEILFGESVRVEGYGFSGRLGGSLRIIERQPGAALAEGEVRIFDGKYEAYGQELTISEGRLFYAAMPLDNPGLDFRAVRTLPDVTVGILVGGRLQAPEVSLFSDPPMEESDQLAYLVLGRPLSAATEEEAGSLQNAARSLGLAGGGRLAREIGSQFGLDVVEVGAETDIAGAEQAALVLGKYLSPKLYIQYAVGIWEAVNTVRVRYQLGRNWVLEAASGPQSSTDLLYSIER